MRVAIVHYHLKRGGVTRIIESTLRGFDRLDQAPQCVVLAGEVPEDFHYRERARRIEGLHYSNAQAATPDSRTLLQRMRHAARAALGGEPDLWHFHNHSLGKNAAMPGVVAELAESGEPLLLQLHDFAEDGRPENHRLNLQDPKSAACLYPKAGNVHYAVINARDAAIFEAAGLHRSTGISTVPRHSGAQLHLLPNPVEAQAADTESPVAPILDSLGANRLFLYPVRAVRRKNFGEMLLWAALSAPGDVFATTLGPTNRNYLATYQDWLAFAVKHRLPVRFGITETHDWPFEAIMQSAQAILSTSIAEGFGLAFLEPWLFGKSIVGRDLPAITADFKAHGIQCEGLYASLPVPADWIDLNQLSQSISNGLRAAYAAYHRPLPSDAVERALAAISPLPDHIDFGGLDESLQQSVIERVLADPSAARQLPRLGTLPPLSTISENARRVSHSYGLTEYAEKLYQRYADICSAPREANKHYLNPANILDSFLQPERFRLLRT